MNHIAPALHNSCAVLHNLCHSLNQCGHYNHIGTVKKLADLKNYNEMNCLQIKKTR